MTAPKPSLQARLARHVLIPLALFWTLGTIITMAVAQYFAEQAFDRALLDDAYALATHVQAEHGHLSVTLTPGEVSMLLFDQSESMYFSVLGADGTLVAGQAGLFAPMPPPARTYGFSDVAFDGKLLRAVNLRAEQKDMPFNVVIAQTTTVRSEVVQEALLYAALPQVLLLLGLAWWLRRSIASDLRPLGELQQAIDRRDANDLAPLPQALGPDASTRDVERISAAVDSLLARLQHSLEAQREFAGNVAHELRTPLAGIRAQASLALASPDPSVWRQELQGIAQAEQRASRLVDQLLALARAAEGSEGLNLESLPVNELAREVLLRFLPRAEAAGVDLGGAGLDDTALVRADRALVEGMLANLLDNALRYAKSGSPRVTVSVEQAGDAVELAVIDNGPGLPEGEAPAVQGRWAQGEAGVRLGQGAGLGLAIVRRYAELLGARLEMRSAEDGRGLRASVLFPAAPAQSRSA